MTIFAKAIRKIFMLGAIGAVALVGTAAPAFAGGGALGGALAGLGGAIVGAVGGAVGAVVGAFFAWLFDAANCNALQTVSGTSLGTTVCNVVKATDSLPGLITALAYMMGLIMTVTALIKLKEHVLNPQQTPFSDSIKRFVAGGALFTLPIVTNAAQNLLTGGTLLGYDQSGFAGDTAGGGGLDSMILALVTDLYEPVQIMLGGFGYLAGLIFIVIGITRLLNTAREGPRGPSGVGTIMTFVVAGALFSLDSMMGAFSSSLFGNNMVFTFAQLDSSTGDAVVDDHILAVISAVIGFMTLVGWISFIRGFFLLRQVAEGDSHASLMAAMTHLFGGALAVNLGPLMNAVQSTFGLTGFGISFF
jgi:hypothetical protein